MKEHRALPVNRYGASLEDFVQDCQAYGATTVKLSGPAEELDKKLLVVAGIFLRHDDTSMYDYAIAGIEDKDRRRVPYYQSRISQLVLPQTVNPNEGESRGNRVIFQILAASKQVPVFAVAFYTTAGCPEEIVTLTMLPGFTPVYALNLIRANAHKVVMGFD